MAQNSKIINSWSLIAFAKEHGRMKVTDDLTNHETGEVFKCCCFIAADDTKTFVAFSHKMGVLTAKEIAAQKDNLQVVQLESGNFTLCRKGQDTWEDVDLGI